MKKRAVDPNAPPRPNLMTHDVKLRTAEQQIAHQNNMIAHLEHRLREVETKLRAQTDYMSVLHDTIRRR